MRDHRTRNRRNFQLESLEWRNAPSHGAMGAIVAHSASHAHHDNHGAPHAEVQHNQRGRDTSPGRHDAVDNDPGTPGVVDNDPNDMNDLDDPNDVNDVDENANGRGRGRGQGSGHDGSGHH
jgi:hypothetical protein